MRRRKKEESPTVKTGKEKRIKIGIQLVIEKTKQSKNKNQNRGTDFLEKEKTWR